MNNSVFNKTMENVKKHRDIKLVTTDRRKNCLVSEPNYHTRKVFSENVLAIEIKRTQILINEPIYLGLLILELCKIVMYEFLAWLCETEIWRKIETMLYGYRQHFSLHENRRYLCRNCKRCLIIQDLII